MSKKYHLEMNGYKYFIINKRLRSSMICSEQFQMQLLKAKDGIQIFGCVHTQAVICDKGSNERGHEKTGFLHMRKQRRRSAMR